jgi:hypothetical protein
MNRRIQLALGVALMVAVMGGAAGRASAQEATDAAQQAANDWLALVDQGRYNESYDQASQSFKVAVGREEWSAKAGAARRQAGKLLSRKLSRATETRNPPNAARGDYVFVVFNTSFTNLQSAIETVVTIRDKDGKWRVINYMIRPARRQGP